MLQVPMCFSALSAIFVQAKPWPDEHREPVVPKQLLHTQSANQTECVVCAGLGAPSKPFLGNCGQHVQNYGSHLSGRSHLFVLALRAQRFVHARH